MGRGYIVRKSGSLKKIATPTLNIVSVESFAVNFTVTNNDDIPVTIISAISVQDLFGNGPTPFEPFLFNGSNIIGVNPNSTSQLTKIPLPSSQGGYILNVVAVANGRKKSNFTSSSIFFRLPFGDQIFTTPGTYQWTAPAGVTSVSVVCVGGGGGPAANTSGASGAGGGGLGWKNNISVLPGTSYQVVVGSGGTRVTSGTAPAGGTSHFINTSTVAGFGGAGGIAAGDGNPAGGTFIGDGGGNGGAGGNRNASTTGAGGGGGAGGYRGNGGDGGNFVQSAGTTANNGVGGAGGGGGRCGSEDTSGAGGGVYPFGEGLSGYGGANSAADGYGGFGGSRDLPNISNPSQANASQANLVNNNTDHFGTGFLSTPGLYGGGGAGADNTTTEQGNGGNGVVRIIWGTNRNFPFNAAPLIFGL